MAALSPAISDKNSSDTGASPASSTRNITSPHPFFVDQPKHSLRGLNKPKCIRCGNIARARCPFQSCKGCCVKAENPCHIHVLKQTSILPDKPPPPPPSAPSEQPSIVTSSAGAALRLSSLRQLSHTFANSLRTKRPLSHKDAVNINKWRFAKLKEYFQADIEIENEAFDRYMQNVRLLEETFSTGRLIGDDRSTESPGSEQLPEQEFEYLVAVIKTMLRSRAEIRKNIKDKVSDIVERALKNLQKLDDDDDEDDIDDDILYLDDLCSEKDPKRRKKIIKTRTERTAMVSDLLVKLSRARTEDDVKSCMEFELQLFDQEGRSEANDMSNSQVMSKVQETQPTSNRPLYPLPKFCSKVEIGEISLSEFEEQFYSLGAIKM